MVAKKRIPAWYRDVLRGYFRKAGLPTVGVLILLFIVAIIQLYTGTIFEWKNIEPIEQPNLLSRILYSALVFVSLGAVLYGLRFYKFLSAAFGTDRRGYVKAKRLLWVGLILIMYFYIVPTVVDLLNSLLSFVFNLLLLMVYLSPLLLISVIATLIIIAAIIFWIGLARSSSADSPFNTGRF